jgi:hypothetical protein
MMADCPLQVVEDGLALSELRFGDESLPARALRWNSSMASAKSALV